MNQIAYDRMPGERPTFELDKINDRGFAAFNSLRRFCFWWLNAWMRGGGATGSGRGSRGRTKMVGVATRPPAWLAPILFAALFDPDHDASP